MNCVYCGAETSKHLCMGCMSILDAAWAKRDAESKGMDFAAPRYATARAIMSTVAAQYGLTEERLAQRSRYGDQAPFARKLCMYLLPTMAKITLSETGALMGGRDHSTVVHARDEIAGKIAVDANFAEVVKMIGERCEVASNA